MKKTEVLEYLTKCGKILNDYKLPSWDELPHIDLYMDQVIELVNNYLDIYRHFQGDSFEITRPMINNYVKLGMMPPPVKKKYSRKHLAYILIICTLKQTLNISTIQKILPPEISEEEVIYTYNSFVLNQMKAIEYVCNQVESTAAPILKAENNNPQRANDLILQVASSANILKCLTEKIADDSE